MYKNIDFEFAFENDFEGDCEAISNWSSDFEVILIWKARVQKAESERRAFRKANLKGARAFRKANPRGALSEKLI